MYLNFLSLGYNCKLCYNFSIFIMQYVYAPLIIIHFIHYFLPQVSHFLRYILKFSQVPGDISSLSSCSLSSSFIALDSLCSFPAWFSSNLGFSSLLVFSSPLIFYFNWCVVIEGPTWVLWGSWGFSIGKGRGAIDGLLSSLLSISTCVSLHSYVIRDG